MMIQYSFCCGLDDGYFHKWFRSILSINTGKSHQMFKKCTLFIIAICLYLLPMINSTSNILELFLDGKVFITNPEKVRCTCVLNRLAYGWPVFVCFVRVFLSILYKQLFYSNNWIIQVAQTSMHCILILLWWTCPLYGAIWQPFYILSTHRC